MTNDVNLHVMRQIGVRPTFRPITMLIVLILFFFCPRQAVVLFTLSKCQGIGLQLLPHRLRPLGRDNFPAVRSLQNSSGEW